MEFNFPEDYSKSSSEETDRSSEHNNDDMGTGRSYECVFCRRGFTTAQALGGHMNIHRKDRANNKAKPPNFPPSSSSKVDENYADLGYYSPIPSHLVARRGNYYSTTVPDHEVENNNCHTIYFPPHAYCGTATPNSYVHYSEILCVENKRDSGKLCGQDWRQRGLSLYTNPLCVRENNDKLKDNSEEDGLDLELRLGHHP